MRILILMLAFAASPVFANDVQVLRPQAESASSTDQCEGIPAKIGEYARNHTLQSFRPCTCRISVE